MTDKIKPILGGASVDKTLLPLTSIGITQITAAGSQNARGHGSVTVFGLGDDQKVYIWDVHGHTWQLFA